MAMQPDRLLDPQFRLSGPGDRSGGLVVLVTRDQCGPALCHPELLLQRLRERCEIAPDRNRPHDMTPHLSQIFGWYRANQADVLRHARRYDLLNRSRHAEPHREASLAERRGE